MRNRLGLLLTALAAAALPSAPAQAQEPPPPENYILPEPLSPCFAPDTERTILLEDCRRLLADTSQSINLRYLANLQIFFDKLKNAQPNEETVLQNGRTELEGYAGVGLAPNVEDRRLKTLGEICTALRDFECTFNALINRFDLGRLELPGYYELATVARDLLNRDTKELADSYGQRIREEDVPPVFFATLLALRSVFYDWAGADADQLAVLKDLASRQIPYADDANLVCWELTVKFGEAAAAQNACNSTVRLDPDNGGYLDSRAMMHFALKDYWSAVSDFERALSLINPEQEALIATVKFGLAMALDKRAGEGDAARAKGLRSEAVAVNPELPAEFASYKIY